jgi:hypothetical protein
MVLKLSSSRILSLLVGLFVLLLLGLLVFSLRLMNRRYDEYKFSAIMNSPYQSQANVTAKYALGGGFEIEYQFKGKHYGEVMKVGKDLYNKYQKGDKIPITISSTQPSLAAITSELDAYQEKQSGH